MEGHLLLFDLGYFKIERFREIDDSGGFFISHLKTNSNPLLLRSLREGPGNRIDLRHWRLREVEPYLRRQVLDAEGLFAPRNITDKKVREIEEAPAFRPLRFVGVKNEKTGEYHLYVTHLPADKVSPEEIADLYRARWAVEIFFKELKSYFGLSSIGSGKKHIVEIVICVALLTVIVSGQVRREPEKEPRSDVKEMGPLLYAEHFHHTRGSSKPSSITKASSSTRPRSGSAPSGPIPCPSTTGEDGWRMSIARENLRLSCEIPHYNCKAFRHANNTANDTDIDPASDTVIVNSFFLQRKTTGGIAIHATKNKPTENIF
ncbi:IS4 family transposase [Aminirod propionatiphilus]|uniref:IS4 family transposase n=1 Tax=Aminirod propionatiphilus TaxID=3415223 RepID=A0ACD1DZL5_9BACT|nr:IS4 family transposase [Synergistota bacterium]